MPIIEEVKIVLKNFFVLIAKKRIIKTEIEINPMRTGIVMGTAMSGISTIAFTQDALTKASHKKVGPRFIPKILGNIATE